MFNDNGVETRDQGWILTTDRWALSNCFLILPVNCDQLSVKQELRASEYETKNGKLVSIARQHRLKGDHPSNSLFKDFALSIKVNSGNIMRIPSKDWSDVASSAFMDTYLNKDESNVVVTQTIGLQKYNYVSNTMYNAIVPTSKNANVPGIYSGASNKTIDVPIGIQNLYALLELVDEPMTYIDPVSKKRKVNHTYFLTSTFTYPVLMFVGVLTDNISWEENSDNPNEIDVNLTMNVTNTRPQLGYGKINYLLKNYNTYFSSFNESSYTMLDWAKQLIDSINNK